MANKILISFFLAILSLQAQAPAVSNLGFDGLSHSVVRINFTSSAKFSWMRVRYAVSPATCTGGTGGSVQGSSYNNYNNNPLNQGPGNTVVLGGLSPATTYQVCPEISTDFGNWSSGAGISITTLPLPAIHPALPAPPKLFDSSYPSTAGYQIVNVANDCSDFVGKFSAAIASQMTTGTVINLPAGQTCTNGPYNITQRSPDLNYFNGAAVNTAQSTLTVPNHGFSEGNGIIFGTLYGCLPGSTTTPNCLQAGPLIAGQLYYVHVVDGNTIQMYSSAPMTTGGTLCVLTDGGNGTEFFVRWPRPLNWIVIRTSTPDGQFAPVQTRVNPAWGPKMANLQLTAPYMHGTLNQNILMNISDEDGHNMDMTANVRFVGVEFSYQVNPASSTSSDPPAWAPLVRVNSYDQSIIFDRCWFHNPGTPSRVFTAIFWDGMNSAIVDSYLDGLEFFKSMYSGLNLTKVN